MKKYPFETNTQALLGFDYTDIDTCNDMGIDPAYCNTKELNEQACNKVFKNNCEDFVRAGMTPDEALAKAKTQLAEATKLWRNAWKIRWPEYPI